MLPHYFRTVNPLFCFFTPEISESASREFYEKLNASFKEDYGLSDMLEPEERGRYLWRTDCVRKRAFIFC